jgi:NAD-dependent DNA ligase
VQKISVPSVATSISWWLEKNAGSKLDKANQLGTVQIMTEEEFLSMVQMTSL